MEKTEKTRIAEVAEDVRNRSREAIAKASDVFEDVKGDVSALAGKAGAGAKSAAETGKDKAADALHGLAGVARDLAGRIDDGSEDSKSAKVAAYARSAATSVEEFSERVKARDVDELARDLRDTARENALLTIGIAALAGFALARFLKGSAGDRD